MAFHCFPRLPIEIRLEIWALASCSQDPRPDGCSGRPIIIRFEEVQYKKPEVPAVKYVLPWRHIRGTENPVLPWVITSYTRDAWHYREFGMRYTCPLVTLSVCQDSRHEAIRLNPNFIQAGDSGRRVYFNAALDDVFLDQWSLQELERCVRNRTKQVVPQLIGFQYIRRLAIQIEHDRKLMAFLIKKLFTSLDIKKYVWIQFRSATAQLQHAPCDPSTSPCPELRETGEHDCRVLILRQRNRDVVAQKYMMFLV